MRDRVWLSVELAQGAGYPALHRWLSQQGAKECGPGLYTFFYEHRARLEPELTYELERTVELVPADRLYLIYKDPDDGEVTGVFISGERRPAPWERTN